MENLVTDIKGTCTLAKQISLSATWYDVYMYIYLSLAINRNRRNTIIHVVHTRDYTIHILGFYLAVAVACA